MKPSVGFETAIAAELARETGEDPNSARPRVAAAQLTTVYRLLASAEVLEFVKSKPKSRQRAAFRQWFDDAIETVRSGIGAYARRQ